MYTPQNRESLLRILRYMRVGKRQHHVTVHHNGRCLVRASVLRRMGVSSDYTSVFVAVDDEGADIVFCRTSVSGTSRLVHPVRPTGTVCACAYFYSKRISRAASSGSMRLRFLGRGERKPDGTIRVRLSFSPVRDAHSLLYNS